MIQGGFGYVCTCSSNNCIHVKCATIRYTRDQRLCQSTDGCTLGTMATGQTRLCPTNRSARTPTFSVEKPRKLSKTSFLLQPKCSGPVRVRRTGPSWTMAKCSSGGVAWPCPTMPSVVFLARPTVSLLHSNHWLPRPASADLGFPSLLSFVSAAPSSIYHEHHQP